MKLNYEAPLVDPKGQPVGEATLGAFLYDILLAQDPELVGEKKLKLARIAQKIVKGEEVAVEDVALIKERVHKYASVSVILCVEDLLEGRE